MGGCVVFSCFVLDSRWLVDLRMQEFLSRLAREHQYDFIFVPPPQGLIAVVLF
jgi:hypothetical protein